MTDTPLRKDLSERALGTLLLLPAALLLATIVVYPIATLLWTSLTSVDPNNPQAGEQFVGLGNYLRAFDDDRFWRSTGNTLLYIVVTVPGALVVGLGLALLANQSFRVKWPVRLGLLLPWALPLVFAGLIFRWFFEYNQGIVNNALVWLGGAPLPGIERCVGGHGKHRIRMGDLRIPAVGGGGILAKSLQAPGQGTDKRQ